MITAILCRVNAPLVKCAFDLIRRNIKVRIIGRDVAKKLKDVIADCLEFRRNCDMREFTSLLNAWINDLRFKYSHDEAKEKFLAECEDYHSCLMTLSQNCEDVYALYKNIDTFFVDSDQKFDKNTIVLCSGHRSKGLEWDQVVVLRPDLLPHPNANSADDLKQEENLEYVILTRAKQNLIICHDDSI